MTFEIKYWETVAAISIVWVIIRAVVGIREKKVSAAREAKLLMVYICLIVIARIVYFPWHHVDGQIGTMKFDSSKITPLWLNLVPVVHLFEKYDGWQRNLFGNIAMFIPVGIVWPACFKKLDTIGKTILAGLGLTACIEITQLLFYERGSDIDDIILNTAGAVIGALIFFGCRRLFAKKKGGHEIR